MVAQTEIPNSGIAPSERSPDAESAIDDRPLSEVVIATIADLNGCSQTELPPLHDALDPDALDALFESRYEGSPRTEGRVEFVYADCEVVVESDRVAVYA